MTARLITKRIWNLVRKCPQERVDKYSIPGEFWGLHMVLTKESLFSFASLRFSSINSSLQLRILRKEKWEKMSINLGPSKFKKPWRWGCDLMSPTTDHVMLRCSTLSTHSESFSSRSLNPTLSSVILSIQTQVKLRAIRLNLERSFCKADGNLWMLTLTCSVKNLNSRFATTNFLQQQHWYWLDSTSILCSTKVVARWDPLRLVAETRRASTLSRGNRQG